MSPDDHQLIRECLQGRIEAFGELVRRYQDRLYNTAYRFLSNADDARDVVQETFLHAYQALDTFKGDSLFFTWLYRIAMNSAINLKRKHRAALSIDWALEGRDAHEPHDPDPSSRPGYALEMAEEERSLQQALNRLSPEHRAVLIMKDMEGMKYEAMAEILEVPIGTIRSRLHRARLEMREILLKEKKR